MTALLRWLLLVLLPFEYAMADDRRDILYQALLTDLTESGQTKVGYWNGSEKSSRVEIVVSLWEPDVESYAQVTIPRGVSYQDQVAHLSEDAVASLSETYQTPYTVVVHGGIKTFVQSTYARVIGAQCPALLDLEQFLTDLPIDARPTKLGEWPPYRAHYFLYSGVDLLSSVSIGVSATESATFSKALAPILERIRACVEDSALTSNKPLQPRSLGGAAEVVR